MTAGAVGCHRAVIEAGIAPGINGVAVIAKIIAEDMIGMFSRCADVIMTLTAFDWCAFELASRVTVSAIDSFVFAN